MKTYRFEWKEFATVLQGGMWRRMQALYRGQIPNPRVGEIWDPDLIGALGEAAVASVLDVYWRPGSLGDRDVARYEVRSTTHERGGLILHESDEDGVAYICAIVRGPEVTLAGWLVGGQGKVTRYWRSDLPRPCYLVPQEELFDIDDLVRRWEERDGWTKRR